MVQVKLVNGDNGGGGAERSAPIPGIDGSLLSMNRNWKNLLMEIDRMVRINPTFAALQQKRAWNLENAPNVILGVVELQLACRHFFYA